MPLIRVELPAHLRTLARVSGYEVTLEVAAPVTIARTLDALEAAYPMLCGTIRDHVTRERRAFLRFFACQRDLSHDPTDATLPAPVVSGREPLIVLGAVAGGVTVVVSGAIAVAGGVAAADCGSCATQYVSQATHSTYPAPRANQQC